MRKTLIFAYGVVNYIISLGVFLYLAGFLGNFLVPKSIDSAPTTPFGQALLINTLLVGIFGLQHTLMARPAFKNWITRLVPEPAERSTYMLFTNVALILLFWLWQPMGGYLWYVDHPIGQSLLYAIYGFGWFIVLTTTFLINHFDLFGLRQVWLYLRGKPYTQLNFVTPGPYQYVRHPLYIGWLTVFWATPTMTIAHFVFAVGLTVYIMIAIQFEERDLMKYHGEAYVEYRRRTPMLLPLLITTESADRAESQLTSTT